MNEFGAAPNSFRLQKYYSVVAVVYVFFQIAAEFVHCFKFFAAEYFNFQSAEKFVVCAVSEHALRNIHFASECLSLRLSFL